MNFEDYSKSTLKRKKDYVEYSNAEKNLSESKKNLAEVQDLAKPLYKKSNFWITLVATLLPTFLGVIAFYGTNAREFFDNKVKEIKLEKRELTLQIDSLNRVRQKFLEDSLFISEEYGRKVREEKAFLTGKLKKDSIIKTELKTENELLSDKIYNLRQSKKTNKELIEDLASAYHSIANKNNNILELKLNHSRLFSNESSSKEYRYTLLMKNIFLYMISENKNRISLDELSVYVDSSINYRLLASIINEYGGNPSELFLSLDEKTNKSYIAFGDKINTHFLIDFYFVD